MPNLARFIFLDPRAQDFYVDWALVRSMTAAMLRLEAGRDPLNSDLTALIGQLSTLSPRFRQDWADRDVHAHRTGRKVYRTNRQDPAAPTPQFGTSPPRRCRRTLAAKVDQTCSTPSWSRRVA